MESEVKHKFCSTYKDLALPSTSHGRGTVGGKCQGDHEEGSEYFIADCEGSKDTVF
jgi:hypothetical protein